jgi:hypothetical protein
MNEQAQEPKREPPIERLLCPKEVARHYSISHWTVYAATAGQLKNYQEIVPPWIRVGRFPRWPVLFCKEWELDKKAVWEKYGHLAIFSKRRVRHETTGTRD